MVLTGDIIDAQTAFNMGIVNKVVPVAELEEAAFKLARSLARKSPTALRTAKVAMNYAENNSLKAGLEYEQKVWSYYLLVKTETEGMKAFLGKRKPNYTGR